MEKDIVKDYLIKKKGFILVSHDRDFLDAYTNHILSINRTSIDVCKGNFSTWQENKRRRDENEISRNDQLQKDIKRLKKAAGQTALNYIDIFSRIQLEKLITESKPTILMVEHDAGFINNVATKIIEIG